MRATSLGSALLLLLAIAPGCGTGAATGGAQGNENYPRSGTSGTLYFSQEDNPNGLYRLDLATGLATLVGAGLSGTTGLGDNALSEGPGIDLLGSTPDDIARIPTDGSGATVLPGSEGAEGLAYHEPNGILYAIAGGDLKTLDAATGLLVSTLAADPGEDLEGLASDRVGTIYAVGESFFLHAYDVATDTWRVVGPTGLGFELNDAGLAYDPVQDVLYAITDGSLYRLDPSTGAATLVGSLGLGTGFGGGLAFLPRDA